MKKIVFILFIAFLLAAGAVLVWVLTLDINQYRGFLSKKIEETTGNTVEMGRISLAE